MCTMRKSRDIGSKPVGVRGEEGDITVEKVNVNSPPYLSGRGHTGRRQKVVLRTTRDAK